MRHVVIGNSAAGVRGAETLRSLDPEAEITIISEESTPAYSRCILPDYLAGTRDEESLRIRPRDFYSQNRIKTLFGKRAAAIDAEKRSVVLADNSAVPYDKLLIATGASSVMPSLPGVSGKNVFSLRNLADAKAILTASSKAQRVVVVGAGFVGLETAYALSTRGMEVVVVEKMPRILGLQLDCYASEIIRKDMEKAGIQFILGRGIKEIRHSGFWGRLLGQPSKQVILEDGEVLKADFVVIAVGTRTNLDVVRGTGMVINRGIVVNEYMETSIPDIYAAGDVAETKDIVTGSVGLTPIWPNASTQGRIAAYNMTGSTRTYGGLIGLQNSVEFREVPAIAMGLSQSAGDEFEIFQDYRPEQNRYKKIVLKDNILVGMILVGDIHQAGIYGALIKQRANVKALRNNLMEDNFGYADIYHSPLK